jgi:hypothetical protein
MNEQFMLNSISHSISNVKYESWQFLKTSGNDCLIAYPSPLFVFGGAYTELLGQMRFGKLTARTIRQTLSFGHAPRNFI